MPTSPVLRRRSLLAAVAALPWPLPRDAAAAAPPLLLASADGPHIDPSRYLVSEKYDGVRALWDGTTLRFRSGRRVPAPGDFLRRLPAVRLDGELWLGRGRFDALSGLVRTEPPDEAAWRAVRYMVFDLPGAPGGFAERSAALAALVAAQGWPALQAVPQRRVADRSELMRLLDETVRAGGEGLMLHRADATATATVGRSDVLVKLKPQLDAEARVVGHRPGRGKYEGQLGALLVETPDGRRFALGSGLSDAERQDPPPLGSIVTYRYRDLTPGGLPRFATFLRVRDEP
jgi:DNA ligase-1